MFSFPDAAAFLDCRLEHAAAPATPTGISIDTRTLKAGDLFLALQGTRQDGHDFLEEAFRRGASGALIAAGVFDGSPLRFQQQGVPFRNLLVVPDPFAALQALAFWCRSTFPIPYVGVTGSVGKTSTKEFLAYLLRRMEGPDRVLSSRGNFNNHLGLPISLLYAEPKHAVAVNELGANHRGEITAMCDILRPTAGLLTMVAPVHLEGFGSLENIYEAKLELFKALPPGAPAVISDHDPELERRAAALPVRLVRVGSSAGAQYRISEGEVRDGWVSFTLQGRYRFSFPGIASFLALNAGMAAAMAAELGYGLERLPERWDGMVLPDGRFALHELGRGIRAVYDGYNASPESFDKALEAFRQFASRGRKIVVFADMLELGSQSESLHRGLGRKMTALGLDAVFAYGPETRASIEEFRKNAGSAAAEHFETREELENYLVRFLREADCLLVKGSRGMRTEKILDFLKERNGAEISSASSSSGH